MHDELLLSKKYASAFVKTYQQQLITEDCYLFNVAATETKKMHQLLRLLDVPYIKKEKKHQTLVKILSEYKLPDCTHFLTDLLISHQRVHLLPSVFEHVYRMITKQKNILPVIIKSSLPLEDKIISRIENFLRAKTGSSIVSKNVVDRNLIAGIRIESSEYVWEHSIAQQLRKIRNILAS